MAWYYTTDQHIAADNMVQQRRIADAAQRQVAIAERHEEERLAPIRRKQEEEERKRHAEIVTRLAKEYEIEYQESYPGPGYVTVMRQVPYPPYFIKEWAKGK